MTLSASAYDFMTDGIASNEKNVANGLAPLSKEMEAEGSSEMEAARKKVALKGTQVTIDKIIYDVAGDTAIVYNGSSCTGAVTIPSTITYSGKTYSVTKIGSSAFYGCTSLTSVAIPNSVTTIGSSAFYGCTSLTSVTIPNSVTTISSSAFSRCSSLTSVTIGNSVTKIGSTAFYRCSSLKGFYVDSNNPNYCSVQGVLFSKDKTTLICYPNAKGAAYEIPNSVTTIGNGAFYGCSSLASVSIPNSVTTIGYYAFEGCTSLTSVEIPNSVTTIGCEAFEGCSSLTSVEIPNSVTTIGDEAFEGCSSLTSVSIGNSVTTIDWAAFSDCSSLKGFYVDGSNPNYCSVQGVLFTKDKTTLICYPNAKGAVYEIPNSVTTIGSCAFEGCSSLTSVTIPNSVTTISSSAFSCCSSLTSVTIPNSVTTIDWAAFWRCSSLISVYCKIKTPLSIGSYTFYNVPFSSATLYVPKGCKQAYASANYWKDFGTITEMDFSIKGDVNEDDVLNVSDVTSIINYLLGTETLPDFTKADLNDDFEINVSDVTALINLILAQ